jgi:hypothetical protein
MTSSVPAKKPSTANSTTASCPHVDPLADESASRLQTSVDRARAQSHRLLHKCTAELRKLQTLRTYRDESFEAGTDISDHGVTD